MPIVAPIRWPQPHEAVLGAPANTAHTQLDHAPIGQIPAWNRPGAATAMLRGFAGRCPCCGAPHLFTGWLRQTTVCAECKAPLGAVRADDAPPYFVIFLVAHLVIAAQVLLDPVLALSAMAEAAVFMPIALALCLGLLRPVKGATVGLMLQLGMVEPANA